MPIKKLNARRRTLQEIAVFMCTNVEECKPYTYVGGVCMYREGNMQERGKHLFGMLSAVLFAPRSKQNTGKIAKNGHILAKTSRHAEKT